MAFALAAQDTVLPPPESTSSEPKQLLPDPPPNDELLSAATTTLSLTSRQQFRRVIARFLSATHGGATVCPKPSPSRPNLTLAAVTRTSGTSVAATSQWEVREQPVSAPGLRKIEPYWRVFTTMAKQRWHGRSVLEVVSTEFRDRSTEFYRYALECGMITVNNEVVSPDRVFCNGDRLENVVHRHEPPVTSLPVQVLHHDADRGFIVVNKPGSIPVHPSGRYARLSLLEILKRDFGFANVHTVNRLDRLTSGLLILPTNVALARSLSAEFVQGSVRKEYIARVLGRFSEQEVTCEEPLLTVDRQIGLNIVHPDGKPAKTVFRLIRYDPNTDSSVVYCKPYTGRSHQIRVHLQFLGHPIANDTEYSLERVWGPNVGKGGVDVTPAMKPYGLVANMNSNPDDTEPNNTNTRQSLPRETGEDIGLGLRVTLSNQVVDAISALRSIKDEEENWAQWRDVVFRAKTLTRPPGVDLPPLQPRPHKKHPTPLPPVAQLGDEDARSRISDAACNVPEDQVPEGYCTECCLPLRPDPSPEKLYIFLHALKYTTSLGQFETGFPEWAAEGWTWER